MLEVCASTSRAHGKRLVATRSAPGAGPLLLFRPDDLHIAAETRPPELYAHLATEGGISLSATARDASKAGDAILCPAEDAIPARLRPCLIVNLLDWASLVSGSAQRHSMGRHFICGTLIAFLSDPASWCSRCMQTVSTENLPAVKDNSYENQGFLEESHHLFPSGSLQRTGYALQSPEQRCSGQ